MSDLGNKQIMSKNLKHYISISGKDRKEIANDLDVSYSTLTDWINGNTYPRIDKIELMANYFGIMKSDLVEDINVVRESGTQYTTRNKLPIVGTIAAGVPLLAEENIEDYFVVDPRLNADYIIKVKGASMINAGILDGDFAFIRQQPEVENGDIAAVLIDGDSATLKRVYRENGSVRLVSENPAIPTVVFNKGDISILGRLVAVLNIR